MYWELHREIPGVILQLDPQQRPHYRAACVSFPAVSAVSLCARSGSVGIVTNISKLLQQS